jgi:hypothetical protein
MKISYGSNSPVNGSHSFKFGDKYFCIAQDTKTRLFETNTLRLFFEGTFYYSTSNIGSAYVTPENAAVHIAALVSSHGIDRLSEHLEGSYVCCWLDLAKNTAGLLGDALNRVSVYYTNLGDRFTISTNLQDVASRSDGLDQLSLYSYLLLGYNTGRDTFYRNVKKLASDESFLFNSSGITLQSKTVPKKIEPYTAKDLQRYDNLFTTAVNSRAAASNVIMNSGGWDSTSILYKLSECQPKGAVSAAVFDIVLPDGQSFNRYEVDKTIRIGKYYGIETERTVIDYSDKSLIDYWNSHTEHLRNNHTYFWLHHLKIADDIGKSANADTRVFNGEGSDSIHNFGFSQFISVNFDNIQLREMADKAKNYLYSPSFFESIGKQECLDDEVLSFFQQYHGKERFFDVAQLDNQARRERYFEAFVLSSSRVPFAKWQMDSIARNKLQRDYAQHLNTKYFHDVIEQCRPGTLYYWLLQLYRRFHFNSYQMTIMETVLKPHSLHGALPFMDSQLLDYMYRMPEDWGRSLELRTTKYPLRFLAEHEWNIPLHILMEKGPHSYIAEGDKKWSYSGGNWNITCEIMFKSALVPYFRSVLSRAKLEDIFNPDLFDVERLHAMITNYVAGEERTGDANMLFRLAVLFSVGFLA